MLRRTAGTLAPLLLASLVVSAPEASARFTEFHHGALCNPATTGDAVSTGYNEWGIHNSSTSQAINVTCGGLLTQDSSQKIAITVYDRHGTQDICCTGILKGITGNTLASGQTCSTGFGSASKDMAITFPALNAAVATLECSIPPRVGNDYSHVLFWDLE